MNRKKTLRINYNKFNNLLQKRIIADKNNRLDSLKIFELYTLKLYKYYLIRTLRLQKKKSYLWIINKIFFYRLGYFKRLHRRWRWRWRRKGNRPWKMFRRIRRHNNKYQYYLRLRKFNAFIQIIANYLSWRYRLNRKDIAAVVQNSNYKKFLFNNFNYSLESMCILLGIVRNISAARWLITNGNVLVNSIILKNYTTQINKGDIIQIKKFQLKQRRIRFNTQWFIHDYKTQSFLILQLPLNTVRRPIKWQKKDTILLKYRQLLLH